jgi:outer membrane protein TolC
MKKIIILILCIKFADSNAQQVFNDLDSFLKYASTKSTSLQSGEIKMDLAKKAKIAAIASIPDPAGNMSFSYTDNITLPVTLFPANFSDPNAPAGEYRAQRLGVQYNSVLNNYGEIKLFNLQGWHNLKSSKQNLEATATDNKLTRKSLYENIASTYFNIVQLQKQLQSAKENLLVSDTLLRIAENKFQQGLLKKQDVNDTKVGYLNTQENVNQIAFIIQQQYLTLKTLPDIPEADSIVINHLISTELSSNAPTVSHNNLNYINSLSKESVAKSTYKKNKAVTLPTLSFFASDSRTQYNTSAGLFDSKWDWYTSTYIGFKISMPMPFSASSLTSVNEAKYNHLLAQKNTEHTRIKAELDNKQLSTDYSKAWSQFVSNKEIYELKKESYYKNRNLYAQGLLATEQTLNSFNAMVNSHYSLITSAISLLLAYAKIEINNTIK